MITRRLAAALLPLALAAGCGDSIVQTIYIHDDLAGWGPLPTDGAAALPDQGPCGPCAAPTPVCDPGSRQCVGCLVDDNCPDAQVCKGKVCVTGCSARHAACGDAGSCDVDLGLCHGCLSDRDCKDPKAPSCDLDSGRCGACSPQNDRCPDGTFCAVRNGQPQCTAGCRTDAECRAVDGGKASFACCDHQCVDTASSIANCGGCGNSCGNAPDAACCEGSCASTRTDVKACGGCGNVCRPANAAPLCKVGICSFVACNPGYADCDQQAPNGCEVATDSDPKNCGACARACAIPNASALCIAGLCKVGGCNAGFRDCDGDSSNGCEVDVQHDQKNCGACGASCAQLPNASANCQNGACAIGACSQGWGNCNKIDADGCEAKLDSDGMNCGGCGLVCPTPPHVIPTCTLGVCGFAGCVAGFADCNKNMADGCEVDLKSDLKNCGACGVTCMGMGQNAVAACANSACSLACNAGFGDCNNNAADGCEVNLSSDAANCGKCGAPCANGQQCVGGVCAQYGDWLVGSACTGNLVCGACNVMGNGYHYKGAYNGFQCWFHAHNQNWNTSAQTNIYQLAKHFGLNPATGREAWCFDWNSTPTPLNYQVNNSYNDINNVGAWGCCGGWPTSGGWVCLQ